LYEQINLRDRMGNLLTGERYEVATKAGAAASQNEQDLINSMGILEYMGKYGSLPESKRRVKEAMWRAVEQYDAQNGNQEK
jgi:hypothetical protein